MTNLDTSGYRGLGDNQNVDQAQLVTDRLALDYFESVKSAKELISEGDKNDLPVTSDDSALFLGAIIKQLRDRDNLLEAQREAEKQPFLRGGNAVDSFFFSVRDLIARRKGAARTAKPGMIDRLQARIDAWQEAKIAAERARLEAERREAARLAAIEQARLNKLRQEAEEAERALARARSEASRAEREQAARVAAEAQARAQAEANRLAAEAEEARLATHVKSADISRVRGATENGGGVTLTTAREAYAILTDKMLVNMEALRPFFTDAEVEKALRAWAKSTGHKVQMPGAEVGFRNKGVTR